MDAKIISGKEIAQKREEKLTEIVADLKIKPKVVSILIGDDAPSVMYTNMKQKKAQEIGITFEAIRLPEETDFYQAMQLIIGINQDSSVHGIMVQLPLPKKFLGTHKTKELLELINPQKDVDGLTHSSDFKTAAVEAVFAIIDEEKINLEGKYAVMVGASELIGKPIADGLNKRGAMVKLCDSKVEDLSEFTKRADLIVSATGVPGIIKGDMVKTGVVIIDVGVMVIEEDDRDKVTEGQSETKVVGDVDFVTVYPKASKITPVPGGVGPITVVSLMENVVKATQA